MRNSNCGLTFHRLCLIMIHIHDAILGSKWIFIAKLLYNQSSSIGAITYDCQRRFLEQTKLTRWGTGEVSCVSLPNKLTCYSYKHQYISPVQENTQLLPSQPQYPTLRLINDLLSFRPITWSAAHPHGITWKDSLPFNYTAKNVLTWYSSVAKVLLRVYFGTESVPQ